MLSRSNIIFYLLIMPIVLTQSTWSAKTPLEMKQAAAKVDEKKKPFIIKEQISYSYNYDADDKNFLPGLLSEKGKTIRDYTVFINIHNGSLLNLSSKYVRGTRTLSWATPYEAALRQAMSAIKHPHEQSALLTAWTNKQLRTYISFVIIPKGTEMEFKIGYASPQRSSEEGYAQEFREGGGMQLRLKYLPAGTIVLTESLSEGDIIHEKSTFNLYNIFNQALNNFNNANLGIQLPHSIKDGDMAFTGAEDYVSENFEKIP